MYFNLTKLITVIKSKDVPLTSLSEDIHQEILGESFGSHVTPIKYLELVGTLRMVYAEKGYKRGTNAVKALVKRLMEKDILTKKKDGYQYNGNFALPE